jgi:hypothetical protein
MILSVTDLCFSIVHLIPPPGNGPVDGGRDYAFLYIGPIILIMGEAPPLLLLLLLLLLFMFMMMMHSVPGSGRDSALHSPGLDR